MRFDDRLKTVLAQPARSAHDRAVRWRQLVELLARAGGPPTALVEQAHAEVRAERDSVDEQLRAATARAIARPQLPPELVAFFAADTITVAAPVLAAASLSADQWPQVLAGASGEARRFILALQPDLAAEETAAPAPEEEQAAQFAHEAPPAPETAVPTISDVVARIERLRQARQPRPEPGEDRRRPGAAPGGAALFRWECGPSGEIAWVEGAPRGALVGRSLANPGEHNGVDDRIQRAFALRAPFRDASLSVSGEGAAAGEWKISGVPAFEPVDGRFAGYRGVATRTGGGPEAVAEPARPTLDDDALRELVHEIKTPLNAIIGFAEIIDGQYLGPADFTYRERAAQIVAQARLLLSAIEDLDTAAQLRSAAAEGRGASDVSELLTVLAPDLKDQARRQGAALEMRLSGPAARCALERGLAERIVRRFCGGVIEAASAGERLTLSIERERNHVSLLLDKPAVLRGRSLDQLLGSATDGEGEDAALGSAFSLRLARALAQVAGGDVIMSDRSLALRLPVAR